MAGKHEPVSKRSFYYSVTTAALRGILVITALVLGVFVLSKAFPTAGEVADPEGQGQPTDGGSPGTTDSPSPTPTASTIPPQEEETTSPPEEVVVQVLNGTDTEGLAATTATFLERKGYQIPDPPEGVGDAADFYDITTIFYRQDSKTAAEELRDRFFPTADMQKAPSDADPAFNITLVLGADYAAEQSA